MDQFSQLAFKKTAVEYVIPSSAPVQYSELSLSEFELTTVTEVLSAISHLNILDRVDGME